MDDSKGIPWTKWCVGGKTNIVLNCIDRHKNKDFFKKHSFLPSERMVKKVQSHMRILINKYQKLAIL